MKLSEINNKPEYYDRYMNKCDDVEILDAIQSSIDELNNAQVEKWEKIGNKVYAPGKWTIKDILQHLIDTERIFMFRALSFARSEKQELPYFNEDEYADAASGSANKRKISELVDELRILHISLKQLFASFTDEMLNRTGKGFKGEYSVASIGFILPGHQRWHLDVITEKYKNL